MWKFPLRAGRGRGTIGLGPAVDMSNGRDSANNEVLVRILRVQEAGATELSFNGMAMLERLPGELGNLATLQKLHLNECSQLRTNLCYVGGPRSASERRSHTTQPMCRCKMSYVLGCSHTLNVEVQLKEEEHFL